MNLKFLCIFVVAVGISIPASVLCATKKESKRHMPKIKSPRECSEVLKTVDLEIMDKISEEMLGTEHPDKSLKILLGALLKGTSAQSAAIVLIHPKTQTPMISVSIGLSPEFAALYESTVSESALDDNILHAAEHIFEAHLGKLPFGEINSVLGLRLESRGTYIGAIYLGFKKETQFLGSRTRKNLEKIAKRLGPILGNHLVFKQLKESQIETEEEREHLKEDVKQLKSDAANREQIIALITHDLRGPISAAIFGATVLLDRMEEPEKRARIARIIKSLRRLDKMVGTLLDVGRLRAGESLRLDIAYCEDLGALIRDVVEDLETVHGERFEVKAEASVSGYWSASGIRRVIENLANNAIKYGDPKEKVVISVDTTSTLLAINVQNFGAVLTESEIVSLSTIYRQIKKDEQSTQPGWGVGLTVVRGLVEAHGGNLSIQSSKENGTTFSVKIPYDARSFQ